MTKTILKFILGLFIGIIGETILFGSISILGNWGNAHVIEIVLLFPLIILILLGICLIPRKNNVLLLGLVIGFVTVLCKVYIAVIAQGGF
jgi:hypothetical protein